MLKNIEMIFPHSSKPDSSVLLTPHSFYWYDELMKLLLLVVGLFTFLLPLTNVHAQDVSPSITQEAEVRKDQPPGLHELTQKQIQHRQEVDKKHQEIKEHLKKVPNKHHAQVTEKIHENLNIVNEKLTTSWLKQVNHMSEILVKLEDNLNIVAGEGKDVAEAKTALNNAKAKVLEAENVLKIQALKVYTITITDPIHVGPDVKTARDLLHTDLKIVHQIVKEAHEAVIEATKVAKAIGGKNGQ